MRSRRPSGIPSSVQSMSRVALCRSRRVTPCEDDRLDRDLKRRGHRGAQAMSQFLSPAAACRCQIRREEALTFQTASTTLRSNRSSASVPPPGTGPRGLEAAPSEHALRVESGGTDGAAHRRLARSAWIANAAARFWRESGRDGATATAWDSRRMASSSAPCDARRIPRSFSAAM